MKRLLLSPLALLASPLWSAEPALPKFDSSVIGVPPLSLAGIDRRLDGIMPPASGPAPRPTPALVASPTTARPASPISRMPILRPDPSVNYAMIVQIPESAIDHKLIVREPAIESVK